MNRTLKIVNTVGIISVVAVCAAVTIFGIWFIANFAWSMGIGADTNAPVVMPRLEMPITVSPQHPSGYVTLPSNVEPASRDYESYSTNVLGVIETYGIAVIIAAALWSMAIWSFNYQDKTA